MPNSPFGSRGTSYTTSCSGGGPSPSQQQQHNQHSRSQSPMATISRCQSPTHSAFSPLIAASMGASMHQTRLHQTVITGMRGQSLNSPSSCNSFQFQDLPAASSKPLYPEICLDHVWTENTGVPKQVASAHKHSVYDSSHFHRFPIRSIPFQILSPYRQYPVSRFPMDRCRKVSFYEIIEKLKITLSCIFS